MNNLKKIVLASTLALSSVAANAAVITFGHLSTDSDYDVIADTQLGREYLRFDTFDLTFAQTIAATQVGGIYEGWSIADSDVSDSFLSAVLGRTIDDTCLAGSENYGATCGIVSGWIDDSFGVSGYDEYYYLSTHATANSNPVGFARIHSTGTIYDYDGWSSLTHGDIYSGFNALLYRENTLHIGGFNANAAANNLVSDSTSVPVPATLGLLGLALAGLSFRRKSA